MNHKTDALRGEGDSRPVDVRGESWSVHIPGGVRTDFPDGSHLVEGPDGGRYLVSESGSISGNVPFIRRVQIEDLSRVLRHHVAQVHDTTSHTLHFVGGGVPSCPHRRDGNGMSIEGNNILFRTLSDGVILVCRTHCARAFVNRLLKKCEMKDGAPYWPCPTAVDGEFAPLHFRFLGLFDTVESVGLPPHDMNSGLLRNVPDQVDPCFHITAGHELRACFPLTPVRNSRASCEQLVWPGVHSDIGCGYRPDEKERSDLLARIALNRMRVEGAISGVSFSAPALADKDVHALFEYDEDVRGLFDEYMGHIGIGGSLEAQIFAYMRLYYGWLKVRFGQRPCDLCKGVCSTNPEVNAELQRIQQFHGGLNLEADTMNWRMYLTTLWKTDRGEYDRTIATAGGPGGMNKPLSDEEAAYWDAWLNPPTLSDDLIRLCDRYVRDSRAGFLRIDSSGYLRPSKIIEPSGTPKPAAQPKAVPQLEFS